MRKKTEFIFLIIALPVFAAAEEARLTAFNGSVEVRRGREGQWSAAAANIAVIEGGAVRTGAGASAVVLLPNKTKIWIKESSSLELEQRRSLASRLALVFGKIKLRVPHLLRAEKLEVRTPSAVCAVRGTEFTVETDESGKMNINVLFGEVKLNFVVPPEKGKAEVHIPQGRTLTLEEKGKPAAVALMTAKEERGSLENWNPGHKPEERKKELEQKENDRAQIKDYAAATANSEDSVKNFLNAVKEADLEAGRTLNDVHGNLVRVDQRLVRPDNSTLQFYNIVKRPVYNYTRDASASGGFKYNGSRNMTDRLDLMQFTMKFNRDLPQRIEEWPGFFNGSSVDPVYATFLQANRTYRDEIFFTGEGYKYEADRDELVSNPSVVGIDTPKTSSDDRTVLLAGMLKDGSPGDGKAAEQLNAISRLNIRNSGTGGALEYNAGAGWSSSDAKWAIQVPRNESGIPSGYNRYEKTGDPYLSQFTAVLYNVGNTKSSNAADYVWYAKENYAINNSGSVQRVGDFTKSDQDPFTLLKNVAGESIIYVKKAGTGPGLASNLAAYQDIDKSVSGDYFKGSRYSSGTNIDLVIIPDLAAAAVQRMLPALTKLNE